MGKHSKFTSEQLNSLHSLLYWMTERQRIYLRRAAGELFPWTADKILGTYRFCNVYRENDRTTIWIREHWRKPFAGHRNLWFAIALARQINWPPTLKEIGFPKQWNSDRVLGILRSRAARGEKIYSGAYMLTGGSNKGGGHDKPYITVKMILDPLYSTHCSLPNLFSLEGFWNWFKGYWGFGPFLAYEVVTDLRHTRYLKNARDINTFANVGPGARRALNRIFGRPVRKNAVLEKLLPEMIAVFEWVKRNRNVKILPTLELRDVEHSLCEWDKYTRALRKDNPGKKHLGLDRYQPARRLF